MERDINFYKYEIMVEEDPNLTLLDKIENGNIEPEKINGEIIKIEDFQKVKFSDRFVGLYFQFGDVFNYSPKIVDIKDNLKKKNNPRKNTQIELNEQFFALIDSKQKNIYLSDNNRKKFIIDWLKQKTKYIVILKIIVDEETFKSKLKKVSEINFTLKGERTLFNRTELNEKLFNDIYNYGADSINIIFRYKRTITQNVREKINNLIKRKSDYKSLRIIGRDDKDVDLIFNPNGILSKIKIGQCIDDKTKKFIPKDIFDELILKIKNYEE